MKKWIFMALILALTCTVPVSAAEKEKTKQEKDILIANINGLRNQELRVSILQQVLTEEVAKLRNLEAVFADRYKLDVEKFRKGLYRYDDKSGKIVEQPAPAVKK